MAINPKKLLPPSKTGEIVKSLGSNLTTVSKNIRTSAIQFPDVEKSSETFSEETQKNVSLIRVKVIKIEDILKGTIASEKKALDDKKRVESTKRREKEEEKLEKQSKKETGGIKVPSIPGMGFFDRIKNFITNVILGYFAVRLIDHLPKIIPVLKFLGQATDFVLNYGGKLLDGLVTFIDWGYKAQDKTKGFLKDLGGENFVKVFDAFNGAIGTLIDTAIIAAIVVSTQGKDGILDVGMDMLTNRFASKGAQQAAQSGARTAGQAGLRALPQAGGTVSQAGGIGAGAAASIIAGAGLLASALGEGAFQVRKVAIKPIQNLENAYNKDKNPITKIGRGIALTMVRPFYGLFSTVGFLLDVVGAPFRYAIELLRYPFLSEEDKKKQANNLAKFDSRIREDLRKALNMVTLGLAFKEKGSFGNIYGNKGAQKEMMGKMSGGGITRGGETLGSIRRTGGVSSGRGKIKRKIKTPQKPKDIDIGRPGADVGGEDKLFGIFPNPFKKVVDVFNPFKNVVDAGKDLGKTDYFGPILAITSKITLGQKPTQEDYKQVGLGINMLISKGVQDGQLKGGIVAAFAEGGLVDPDVLSAVETGGDISNWVAKTFKGEIESNAQKTLRLIKENSKKKDIQSEEYGDGGTGAGGEGDGGFQVGPSGSSGDKLTMARNLMRDLKLTAAQAAGIVGNMAAESGVENARPQGSPPGTKAPLKVDGKTGYGLVQWTSKGRQKALADFAKSRGADLSKPLSMNIEYQFFLKEFRGAYGEVLKQIRQSKDVKTSSTIFMQQYEIPAGYKTQSKIMERYNMSKPIYDKLSKGEGKATEGVGTFIGTPTNVSTAAATGPMNQRQKNAGELGSFIKSLGVAKGSGVHEHPQHGGVKGYHRGKGHYEGRAIDIGGWGGKYGRSRLGKNFVDDQSAILAAINKFAAKTGKKPSLVLHGDNDPGHWDHVHAEYAKGGETLPYPHLAMVGERGKEIVIDNDSTVSDPQVKNMLLAINQASNRKSVIDAIREYAPYEAESSQTIVVQSPNISTDEYGQQNISGDTHFIPIGGGEDPFESLYALG